MHRNGSGPLYTTLALIGRHVRGFWPAVLAFIGLGLGAGALLVLLLAAAAGTLDLPLARAVDEAVLHWFAAYRAAWLDDVMRHITRLGDGIVVVMVVLTSAVFLWLTHHRWSVFLLLGGVIGGQVVNNLLKLVFDRPRPDIVDVATSVQTSSFPSGHAMAAILAYGTVAYLASRLEPTPALRRTTWAIAALLVIGIGASRMYLGVHYPSDVIGGFVAGLAWLAFVVAVMRAIQFFAHRRPRTAAEERDLQRGS